LKTGVRRSELTVDDKLTTRIEESARLITRDDCVGWIRHFKGYFEGCLNKKRIL
ncbi:hypothetical protein BJV82DRAFT_527073, partial [Fennellomyces sp. T-0311]